MGYSTDFTGSLAIDKPLTAEQVEYLNRLFSTRRMKRNVLKLMELYSGQHGNPFAKDKTPEAIYGREGEYFAMDDGNSGQSEDGSIIDYNVPPCQADFMRDTPDAVPGLWCGWRISDDGKELEWDGGEKFYNYIEWLRYIIKHFFIPWGVKADGEILWFGEDRSDLGKIKVNNNQVFVFTGEVTYEDED